MPLNATAIGTAVGLAIAAWFAMLCHRDMRRAVVAFVALAWVPFIRMFELAGSRITQHLLLVEVLPTVMIAVWWLGRLRPSRSALVPSSVNKPLLMMIPVSVVSLLWNLGGADPNVPLQHVKLTVSLGQLLLIAWPVGIYFVSANAVRDMGTMRTIVKIVVVMGLPALLMPLLPTEWRPLIGWSVYFCLVASPLCFAASFDTPSWPRKVGLWIIACLAACLRHIDRKAFLYVTTAVALTMVAMLKGKRVLLAAIPIVLGLYVLTVAATGSFVPAPFQELIEVERQQQSWGGRAGPRGACRRHAGDLGASSDLRRRARQQLAVHAPVFGDRHATQSVSQRAARDRHRRRRVLPVVHRGSREDGLNGLRRRPGPLPARRSSSAGSGYFCGMVVSGLTGDFIFHSIRNGGLEMFTGYYLQWIFLGMVVSAADIERRAE